ncbi:MAG: hypothetical protein Pg6B_10540 [Candidatus Azobacteroides pseudotrichonymphae]|nr:MAG: hypothetical protein Pg6B_10540 [Candidatus Azobacteroides pseudotrichonymphae]
MIKLRKNASKKSLRKLMWTPSPKADPEAIAGVKRLWQDVLDYIEERGESCANYVGHQLEDMLSQMVVDHVGYNHYDECEELLDSKYNSKN